MTFLKDALLTMYYGGTLPYRNWQIQQESQHGTVPIVTLFYHRVTKEMDNTWTITNELFETQMDWLAERFEFISLHQLQRRVSHNCNDRPSVAITFDDGYADNLDHAIPLLLEREIPFTYFVTLHNIESGEQFAHDVAYGSNAQPNTINHIQDMADAGVDIGHHGRNHIDLGQINDEAQLYDEIVSARSDLEDVIGKKVGYFAFPFGMHKNLNVDAFRLAAEANYDGVCSAYGGYNHPGDDPFHIQRFHGDPKMPQFKNHVYLDPRKNHVPRFQYHIEKPEPQNTSE